MDEPSCSSNVRNAASGHNGFAPLEKLHQLKTQIEKAMWFWVSIQLDLRAREDLYPVEGGVVRHAGHGFTRKRPLSPSASEPPNRNARRSNAQKSVSVNNNGEGRLSYDSLLEASSDISGILPDHIFSTEDVETLMSASPKKAMSKRQQKCLELLETEKRYVEVLQTVVRMFKEPLDALEGEAALLTKGEMQLVFGKIAPLYELHQRIYGELATLIMHWNEQRCIGEVFLKYASLMERTYPPFVNNYDKAKETLVQCDRTSPKFHAFLKGRQSKPECQRQSLQELLIRPVQRLPSVNLLLKDVLKRTDKNFEDHPKLSEAIDAIGRVLAHINEDKRRTEDRLRIFDIFHEIDDCPVIAQTRWKLEVTDTLETPANDVELVSGQRQFLGSLDAILVKADGTLGHDFDKQKRQQLTFYLFNDTLEITKKRQWATKSPGPARGAWAQHKPTHRHLEMLFLTAIRRITDVTDVDGLFLVTLRNNLSDINTVFHANRLDSPGELRDFLRLLNAQVKAMTGRDAGVHEAQRDAADVSILSRDANDLQMLIDKAAKHVSASNGPRLSRTHSSSSMQKTGLKRAVSQLVVGTFGTLRRMSRSTLRLEHIVEETPSATLPRSD